MKVCDLAHALFSAAGDAKLVHLYATGIHFDTLHKIAGDEYDMLNNYADLFAELSLETDGGIVNPNNAASVAGWASLQPVPYKYEDGIQALIHIWIKIIRIAYSVNDSNPKDLGVQNACQDFIQNAQKELRYKLKHRL